MQVILDGISSLSKAVKDLSCKKVLLVAGRSFESLGIRADVESLDVLEIVRFSGFTPNPLIEQAKDGIKLFKSSGCDSILAVGGGSAIDVAKCIKLGVLGKESVPFIAIPTTAGSGSESTHNAVVYKDGVKQSVYDDAMLPDVAILEPSVLNNLPVYQKKCTMVDALCQGMEAWWSVNSTTESKEYSRKAVELIMANWRKYIFEGDAAATAEIMLASNYAGRAINIAQTTAAHAMSYKITQMFDFPHGHAVAVCLPEIWDYMLANPDKCSDPRGSAYLKAVFADIASSLGATDAPEAVLVFRAMMKELELGLPASANLQADLDTLASTVNPVRLRNNPVAMSPEVCRMIYSKVVL